VVGSRKIYLVKILLYYIYQDEDRDSLLLIQIYYHLRVVNALKSQVMALLLSNTTMIRIVEVLITAGRPLVPSRVVHDTLYPVL
jgi:hypothetical protein